MKGFLYKLGKQTAVTATLLLLVFAPFQTLIAQAEAPQTDIGDTTRIAPAAGVTVSNTNTSNNTTIPASNAGSYQNQKPSTDILASCKAFDPGQCISSLVYVFTIGIGSAFAYVAAYFFDITIQLSLNGASYGLDFISTSWTTARDLGNMAFLFILLYIAFTIILKADTGNTMSLLAGVIIVALIVNFSFFFTRVVIDAGNILAIQFYNAIPAPPISQTIQGAPVSGQIANATQSVGSYLGGPSGTKDLTASIMNMLQVQNLLNNNSFASTNSSGTFNFIATIFIYITAAIVLWILTVAFITNGVKFLFRTVVLWFLIIVSPFAFVAAAVQGLDKGYFKQWREMLLTHAFYPVAFMFIFLILNNFAITVSGGNTNLVSGVFSTLASGAAASNSWGAIGASLVSIAIRLGLVIAVLFVGMKASDNISVAGSKYAEKAGSWFGGGLLKSYNVAYKRVGPGAAVGVLDRSLQKGVLAKVGNTALGYELRRYVTKPLAKTTIPGSHGESYVEMKERQEKEGKERLGNVGGRMAYVQNRTNARELGKIDEKWGANEARLKVLDTAAAAGPLSASETAERDRLHTIQARRDQLKDSVSKMSGAQIAELKTKDIQLIIKHVSQEQVKAIKESLKVSDSDKRKLEKEWHEEAAKGPLGESRAAIKKLSDIHDELAAIGYNLAQVPELTKYAKPPIGTPVTINIAAAKAMTKELKAQHEKEEDRRDDRRLTDAERQEARKAVRELKKAVEKAEALEKNVVDVPNNVGNSGAKGEFTNTRT